MSDKKTWQSHLTKAIDEMKQNKVVLLTRGDLIREEQIPLYSELMKEFEEAKRHLMNTGDVQMTYRYLFSNVFMKHESFFMDLFETKKFPHLFELFELE